MIISHGVQCGYDTLLCVGTSVGVFGRSRLSDINYGANNYD